MANCKVSEWEGVTRAGDMGVEHLWLVLGILRHWKGLRDSRGPSYVNTYQNGGAHVPPPAPRPSMWWNPIGSSFTAAWTTPGYPRGARNHPGEGFFHDRYQMIGLCWGCNGEELIAMRMRCGRGQFISVQGKNILVARATWWTRDCADNGNDTAPVSQTRP